MNVQVTGRNIVVTPALERYALEKVEKMSKFFDSERSDSRAEVELTHTRNRSVVDAEVAEATMFINGTVLKATEASEDMYASIDGMADKLERQVRRYRGRQIDRWQGQDKNAQPAAEDRKSTRLNSSHANISYAVFCLKKKKNEISIRV